MKNNKSNYIYLPILLILTLSILIWSTGIINGKKDMQPPFSVKEINQLPDFNLTKPEFVESTDKTKLAYYTFMPNNPTNIVIFYHGSGLYNNKIYQSVGLKLKEKNIGCYMVDLRGHGLSEDKRGDAPSIKQVWQDVDTIVNLVKQEHPNSKIYLAGHSSGAGLLINYNAFKNNLDIAGYIFLAPYLGPMSKTIKADAKPYGNFVIKARIWVFILNQIFNSNWLKHVPAVYFNNTQEQKNDPLIVPHYTYTMSSATTPYNTKELFEKLKTPFAIYIGEQDEQFIPEKTVEYKQYSPVSEESTAQILPNAKHLSILLEAPDLIAKELSNAK